MAKKLTLKEWELITNHLMQDISYHTGGTFYKDTDTEEFDLREANRVKKILVKIKPTN
ncbi:unnamed protein product [marine sediment metagenome]|uniref:Uncharacterized protein n=1 Tax=marine sediment metagenome TaxID=412755 RepID=X0V137_9ZZZZ